MGIRYLTGTDEALDKYAHPNRAAADQVIRGDSGAVENESRAKERT